MGDVASGGVSHIQDFILERDLAEVYLLLDNVSASPNKALPPPPDPPKPGETAQPDLIKEVCEIPWPPVASETIRAQQAETLVRAKDLLNRLASPATGATIAFTLLVAGEDLESRATRGFFARFWAWLRGPKRAQPAPPAAGQPPAVHPRPGSLSPSRFSLAEQAFPNLVRQASRFRHFIPWVVVMLSVLFVVTAGLSWNIATGNALLAEWNKAAAARDDIAKKIDDATPDRPAANTLATNNAVDSNALDDGSGELTSLKDQRQQNGRDLEFAGANLNQWLNGWDWLGYPRQIKCTAPCAGLLPPSITTNEQWAAAFLAIVGGAVLPILYGLLGAGASVVRQLSARIKESLLAPRHMMLAYVQLALGAVIGGCIGLFVTPSGAPSSASPGLLGAVPLTASALCFIAGFGVDAVFLALEGLIRRVFNMPDPTAKP